MQHNINNKIEALAVQHDAEIVGQTECPVPKRKSLAQRMTTRITRGNKQSGALDIVEAGAWLAAAALLGVALFVAVPYVRNLIQTSTFESEASMIKTGVQNATVADSDVSTETMTTLYNSHAFDGMGVRAVSGTSLVGMFSGSVTAAGEKTKITTGSVAITYPVPAAVCAMSLPSLVTQFTEVDVAGTDVYSPSKPYVNTATSNCGTSGTATMTLYVTKS